MALTPVMRVQIMNAFRVHRRDNRQDPDGNADALFQLMLKTKPEQIAEILVWLQHVKTQLNEEKAGLSTLVADRTANIDQQITQIDATIAELGGTP